MISCAGHAPNALINCWNIKPRNSNSSAMATCPNTINPDTIVANVKALDCQWTAPMARSNKAGNTISAAPMPDPTISSFNHLRLIFPVNSCRGCLLNSWQITETIKIKIACHPMVNVKEYLLDSSIRGKRQAVKMSRKITTHQMFFTFLPITSLSS